MKKFDPIKIGDIVQLTYCNDENGNEYCKHYLIVGLQKTKKRNAIEIFPQINLDFRKICNESNCTTFLDHNEGCDSNKNTCKCFSVKYYYWFDLKFESNL